MPSERLQRQIDLLLDQAEAAIASRDWSVVGEAAHAVLGIDPGNVDALGFISMADSAEAARAGARTDRESETATPDAAAPAAASHAYAGGRYGVLRSLGEGAKKRVYLAHDELLDRDVALALIKTEGLDEVGRERVVREAQAMGRLGTHPHLVAVLDFGQEASGDGTPTPFIVTEYMPGGSVEELLAKGPLETAKALEVASGVAKGLAFAHEQGVVHRDLKPGNVWLTADGSAKIGDFGLAVSLDQSRLTQHGMMIGTVAYMPPEQALGGEVTPRSDLYSLGAMLYELITGRPPFAGDDPTVVISQHINTRPVAPSWHSEHCPPELEALILRLLEKAPDDRPASASEVLESLSRVDPSAKSASRDSSANPLDRLARGVFVGREGELERLRPAADEAFSGRGSVVMLVGEPGIGKTRTAQELETYARMRGAQVLWGRAHEDSGAPAYWPWVQVGRAYRDQTPDETRRREWEPYALELQRIFPGLRELFSGLPEPPPAESEEAQFRLFDALAAFLRSVSERVPLLLVLDDLHWADRPTLSMLTHLAREVGRSRILVLGTYRDTDLDRTHPLSRTLAELNREQLFLRMPLRGLSADEVGTYLSGVTGIAPAAGLVARIHEETEGNPFFLAEVVNLMTEEGTLTADSVSDVAIPEGVRDALGRRLDRLSAEANELLSLAAVLGREFAHEQLVATSGRSDDEVLRLTEEALAARVVEETGEVGGYRFTHALMQETLLGELSAARRVRMHGQIADALEELYGQAEDSATELARHFVQSAVLNRDHARAAARYSRLAAEQAARSFGWDEAAHHYHRCLDLLTEVPDRLGEDEAAIRAALGTAVRNAGRLPEGYAELDRAMELYRSRGDANGFARVALEALRYPSHASRPEREATMRAALALNPEPPLRAAVIVRVAQNYFDSGTDELAVEAREIAESYGLADVLARLDAREAIRSLWDGHVDEGWARLRPVVTAPSYGSDRSLQLVLVGSTFWYAGRVDEALAVWKDAISLSSGASPNEEAAALCWMATTDLARGEIEQAESRLRAAEQVAPRQPAAAVAGAQFAALQGDLEEALRLVREHRSFTGGMQTIIHLLYAQYLWQLSAEADGRVREAFAAWEAVRRQWDDLDQRRQVPRGLFAADMLAALGDEAEIREVLRGSISDPPFVGLPYLCDSADRARGVLALRLGDPLDIVEEYFRHGLEWCERERLVIPEGRCLQGLAEVAERHGEHEQAMEHLDRAGKLFSQYGAKLYLDQVLAKKAELRA